MFIMLGNLLFICIFLPIISQASIEPSFDDQILDKQYVLDNLIETKGLDTNKTFQGKDTQDVIDYIKLIFPGTLWCGAGTKAKSYDELGKYEKTDNCCRNHDNCPTIIFKGESKYGLKNTGTFTRSHCDCDHDFHECLKTANTLVSNNIGRTYFNFLQPQCFNFTHPRTCTRSVRGRCVQYTFDKKKPKQYQWFDSLSY